MRNSTKTYFIEPLIVLIVLCGFVAIMAFSLSALAQIPYWLLSFYHTGTGQYSGTIVETRHHGVLFKTYGIHLKTGENAAAFEDFCVVDPALFETIAQIPPDSKVTISYTSRLRTPVWQCDGADSNDVATAIRIID